MKRMIVATSSSDIDKYSIIAEVVNQTAVNSPIARSIVEADKTGILETFASEVNVQGLILSGNEITVEQNPDKYGHSHGSIEADFQYKLLRKGQTTSDWATIFLNDTDTITVAQAARTLVSEMCKKFKVYYKRYENSLAKSALRDKYNTGTTQLISAFSVACRYVKKYAGLTPTFRYSDSGKAEYMLWALPDVEQERAVLNMDALEAHEAKFEEAIAKFEADTGVSCDAYCPHGGSYVRSAFTLKVDPKIQLVYDKETDTYSQL